MSSPHSRPAYNMRPPNNFFDVNSRLNEYDNHPGNTVTFFTEVDLTQLERLRRAAGERKPSYTAFVAKAVALALRDFPYANRRVHDRSWLPFARRRLQQFHHCDVAIAVERDLPGAEGVAFADVLRDADCLSLAAITDWLRDLAVSDVSTNKQWRDFSSVIKGFPAWLATLLIRLPLQFPGLWVKYRGAAVLISSPAKYGIDVVAATWAWPLGVSFGLVKQRPVVSGNEVVARPTFILTLNFDRRIMAGAPAARFFKRILDTLEHAETEMDPYLSLAEQPPVSPQPSAKTAPDAEAPLSRK